MEMGQNSNVVFLGLLVILVNAPQFANQHIILMRTYEHVQEVNAEDNKHAILIPNNIPYFLK